MLAWALSFSADAGRAPGRRRAELDSGLGSSGSATVPQPEAAARAARSRRRPGLSWSRVRDAGAASAVTSDCVSDKILYSCRCDLSDRGFSGQVQPDSECQSDS